MEWEQVDKRELERLCYEENLADSVIADLFGVSRNEVKKKRKQYNIGMRQHSIEQAAAEIPGLADRQYQQAMAEMLSPGISEMLNQRAKERLLCPENMDALAKALTHYIFRNGPVENMHAEGKLSQKDMKTLNVYMVNHLAWVLTRAFEGNWSQLETLFGMLSLYGKDWDPADPQQVENR